MDKKNEKPVYTKPVILPLGQMPVAQGGCNAGSVATGSCGTGTTPNVAGHCSIGSMVG